MNLMMKMRGVVGRVEKRGAVRKLDDDFDRVVAEDSGRKIRKGKNKESAVVDFYFSVELKHTIVKIEAHRSNFPRN